MVAVVAGLCRQVERDRKTGLPLGEVLAIERIRIARVRMPGIGAEDPGLVALPNRAGGWLAHGAPRWPRVVRRSILFRHAQGYKRAQRRRAVPAARTCPRGFVLLACGAALVRYAFIA